MAETVKRQRHKDTAAHPLVKTGRCSTQRAAGNVKIETLYDDKNKDRSIDLGR
jgi:hypothetical protein